MIDTGQLARIALVAALIVGCFLVLQPFMAGILFAAILCIFTWPYYESLWSRLGERDTLAAIIMTLVLLFVLLIPMLYITANLADSANMLLGQIRYEIEHPQPHFSQGLRAIPLIGESLNDIWVRVTGSQEEMMKLLEKFSDPLKDWGLRGAQLAGSLLLQMGMVVLVLFFFYRDGHMLTEGLLRIAQKLAGNLGVEMLDICSSTVKAVMLGTFGTAFVQAAIALIGYLIAGTPVPLLLAVATFFMSVHPIGPPLIWGGAALWLFHEGEQGWAIFLILYGLLAISTIDNLVRPLLISHSSDLPMLLIVVGVFGGAIAFGFVGIFLGPTLLALALSLTQHWLTKQAEARSAS